MEITPDTTQASKYFHTPGTKETGVIERSTNSFSLGEGGGDTHRELHILLRKQVQDSRARAEQIIHQHGNLGLCHKTNEKEAVAEMVGRVSIVPS